MGLWFRIAEAARQAEGLIDEMTDGAGSPTIQTVTPGRVTAPEEE
jgi:hypothetical protein